MILSLRNEMVVWELLIGMDFILFDICGMLGYASVTYGFVLSEGGRIFFLTFTAVVTIHSEKIL